jgi:hypothetical protein
LYNYLYLPDDFDPPESEQHLYLCLPSANSDWSNLAHFTASAFFNYLEDIQSLDRWSAFPRQAKWTLMSLEEFEDKMKNILRDLKHPRKPELPVVSRVYKLFDDWDFIVMSGEGPKGYFAIFWETTA